MRFGEHPNKIRMVLDLSQHSEFRSFVLDNPYRLIIDLPAFDWQVTDISGPNTAGVVEVRQGALEPGISRIVLDLKKPTIIKSAFILPPGADKLWRKEALTDSQKFGSRM